MIVLMAIVAMLLWLAGFGTLLAAPTIAQQMAGLLMIAAAVFATGIAGVIWHLANIGDKTARAVAILEETRNRIDAREAGDIDRHADVRRMADAFDALAQRRKSL